MLNLVGSDWVPAVLNRSLTLDIAYMLTSLPLIEEELFVPYHQSSSTAFVGPKIFKTCFKQFLGFKTISCSSAEKSGELELYVFLEGAGKACFELEGALSAELCSLVELNYPA